MKILFEKFFVEYYWVYCWCIGSDNNW